MTRLRLRTRLLNWRLWREARASQLENRVRALSKQVDFLNLCLNEYSKVPDWCATIPNLRAVIPLQDKKDIGKFIFGILEESDAFLFADDIHYPFDYVERTLFECARIERHVGRQVVVGYHGTIYTRASLLPINRLGLIAQFLLRRSRRLIRYHEARHVFTRVAQLGTGTVLLRGSQLPPLGFMDGSECRVDVRFGRWCHEKDIQMFTIPRPHAYLPNAEGQEDSIYATYTRRQPCEFLAELRDFAAQVPGAGTDFDLGDGL